MKKRLLLAFGLALLIFSPLWLTIAEPRNYLNFGISFLLGILLLVLGLLTSPAMTPTRCLLLDYTEARFTRGNGDIALALPSVAASDGVF